MPFVTPNHVQVACALLLAGSLAAAQPVNTTQLIDEVHAGVSGLETIARSPLAAVQPGNTTQLIDAVKAGVSGLETFAKSPLAAAIHDAKCNQLPGLLDGTQECNCSIVHVPVPAPSASPLLFFSTLVLTAI